MYDDKVIEIGSFLFGWCFIDNNYYKNILKQHNSDDKSVNMHLKTGILSKWI